MGDIELITTYTLISTLSLLLSLDLIIQWHYRHERSLLYLCTRIVRPISYITFTFLATYGVLLGWLIPGSLWVCLGLKALIIWRFCRLLKDGGYSRAYKVLQFGSRQMTFSIYQLLLIAVLLIIIALHAVAFSMSHRHNNCYIRAPILAVSNCLVFLLASIPAYYLWKRGHDHQEKARGMVVTSGITCLAAVASLGLLGLLANRCDWPEIILLETITAWVNAVPWAMLQIWNIVSKVRDVQDAESLHSSS